MTQINANAERNEMIALIQHAKGARFVKVSFPGSSKTYVYKVIGLDHLKIGDRVIVQGANNHHTNTHLPKVVEILKDVPTSAEYDYNTTMLHVVAVADTDRAKQLHLLDNELLKKITASEASDRLARITQQLGLTLDSISLELPALPAPSADVPAQNDEGDDA